MAYANLNDVQTRLGRAISDEAEIAQVNAWLKDASGMIDERIPDLATRIEDGWVLASTVKRITAQSVIRKVKNPDGVTYESIDDHRQGYNEAMTKGELHFTDDEWDSLLAQPDTGGSGAFTIYPYYTVSGS